MSVEELLPKFQELCPGCYFCKAKHGGEGYDAQRMEDVITGIEPFIGFYLCPDCRGRRAEMTEIENQKTVRRRHISNLRDRGLFDFDSKYRLATVFQEHRDLNVSLFEKLDVYPLPVSVWVYGDCGVGKSHVIRCIGNRYAHDLKSVALITGPKLRDIAEEWGMKRAALVEPYETSDLLIVDDIDKALRWTQNSMEALWSIMDARERRQLRTMVTSQKTPQTFFQGLDYVAGVDNAFSFSILDRMKPLSVFFFNGEPRRGTV